MDSNDSDNDQPEEVSKKISEDTAKATLRKEKIAKNDLVKKLKEQRRQIVVRNIEQKRQKQIERLPNSFLNQLNSDLSKITDDKNDEIKNEMNPQIRALKDKRREKKRKRKEKARLLLKSTSTDYQVMDSKDINSIEMPIIETMAYNFREQMLYDRRNKRIRNRENISNKLKRKTYRK